MESVLSRTEGEWCMTIYGSISGSISDIPPQGPSVYSSDPNVGPLITFADLQSSILASKSAYDLALSAYNAALTPYTTVTAKYSTYLNTPDDPPVNKAAAFLAFHTEYNNFTPALLSALTTARTNLLNARTDYVTNLAYQQIWMTQKSGAQVRSNLLYLLEEDPTNLTTTQKTSLSASQSNLTSAEADLLSAFQEYRHAVYNTAIPQTRAEEVTVQKTLAEYAVVLGIGQQADVDSADYLLSGLTANLTEAQAQEASLLAILNSNAALYETVYNDIKQLGVSATLSPLPFSPPPLVVSFEAIKEAREALRASGLTLLSQQASIPQLPSGTGSMSLVELMNTLGQAHLTSLQLIREAAASERQINFLRSQIEATHLSQYASMLSPQNTEEIQAAYDGYNALLNERNAILYNNAAGAYSFYRSHVDVINNVISAVNQEISDGVVDLTDALVAAVNEINEAAAQAIEAEETSIPVDFNAPTLPLITPIPDITSFPSLLSADLPALTLDTYPTPAPDAATKDALLADFNATVSTLLGHISPFQQRVITALSAAYNIENPQAPIGSSGALPTLDLSKISFYTTLEFAPESVLLDPDFLSALTDTIASYAARIYSTRANPNEQTSDTEAALERLALLEKLLLNVPGAGSSINIAGGNVGAASKVFMIALNRLITSEIFNKTIVDVLQRAAMLAGLSVAATLPEILKQLVASNMTLSDLLDAVGKKSGEELEAQTKTDLINAFILQISLIITTPGALQEIALDMLSQDLPSLEGLSKEDLTNLISGLVFTIQAVLLAIVVMLGADLGLTLSGITTGIFEPSVPIIAGLDELETVLGALGLNENTRTILMAIITASESGAIPDQTRLDTLISSLKNQGITIEIDTSAPDALSQLLSQLVSQLNSRATEQQQAIIKSSILTSLISKEEIGNFQQAGETIRYQIRLFLSTGGTASISPIAITAGLVTRFSSLSPDIQSALLAEVANNPELAAIPGISAEQKAAILGAVRVGALTPTEASSLLRLMSAEGMAAASGTVFSLSETETAIISRIFTPTKDELLQREEITRRDIDAPYIAPSTLSPVVLDQVSIAFRKFANDVVDQKNFTVAFETFFKTIQRLSDFNKVAVDFLLDPANIILRQFSLISRTGQDRIQQPKITISG